MALGLVTSRLGGVLFATRKHRGLCWAVGKVVVEMRVPERACLWSLLLSALMLRSCAHKQPPGLEVLVSTQSNSQGQKVFTTDGRECKFPFRLGGTVYHHCISVSSSRKWCSLTHNFDRDLKWGYCGPRPRLFNTVAASFRQVARRSTVHYETQVETFLSSHRDRSLCEPNPCKNGGVCTPVPQQHSFECACPDAFMGPACELSKCYEPLHLRHYDIGESWGRIQLRNVELCKCLSEGVSCERVRYRVCSSNPCENEGICRIIEGTGEVCACREEYSGTRCSIRPEQKCYRDNGVLYRGTANTTVSGASCLPWNSDLLYDELTVDTVHSTSLTGLGDHSFCRNPDEDALPWCYTMSDGAISWEYCNVPSCPRGPWSRKVPPVHPTPSPSPTPAPGPVAGCGRRHAKRIPRGRILGGSSALPGYHPWMAALYIGEEFCAGSLVSSCWVISAAHCFLRNPLKSTVRVVLGQHFFNDTGSNTRTFGIEKYVHYHNYVQFNPTVHDIVLVKLKKVNGRCAPKTQFIRPICLPDRFMTFPDYTCCTITGWGHMQEKGNSYSHLREGMVKIIPYEKCSAPDVYGLEVRPGMLCAGSDTCVDACQGDSGGPLECVRDGVSFLYGIISWGDGCGRTGKPGVYTKVPKYVSWVNHTIRPKRQTLILS
ncbi:hepatocyte growth factor activator isoform X3 [Colossoma macropomum]|nr:hepatocyte growth factor activator isoform X3 [Colossoma macropomum]XP_036439057.1 hepatocyte growth factor activator isoform X3 [Colossoma macropomum]XP_036439058.1 hepatocyte growth factor activator isoform X3 [Colossoma macropomum]XP_036439059.1 hepatocyte growth factor activator isoform X3 [Colossoma macropomum]